MKIQKWFSSWINKRQQSLAIWSSLGIVGGIIVSLFLLGSIYWLVLAKTPLPLLGSAATLHTSSGSITFRFNPHAPIAVNNFIQLSNQKFYDGVKIHRVVPGFLIETGDPFTKNESIISKWGKGGPGYIFDDEIQADDVMHKGVVAMVNRGTDTNGSQFFIVLSDESTWLNGQHTIIGYVVEGLDVAEAMSYMPTGLTGIPLNPPVINSIEIQK